MASLPMILEIFEGANELQQCIVPRRLIGQLGEQPSVVLTPAAARGDERLRIGLAEDELELLGPDSLQDREIQPAGEYGGDLSDRALRPVRQLYGHRIAPADAQGLKGTRKALSPLEYL
jgi:hypothetical protein